MNYSAGVWQCLQASAVQVLSDERPASLPPGRMVVKATPYEPPHEDFALDFESV
jgi:hypothetical protein